MTTTFDHPILPMPIDTQAKECDHLLLSLLIKFIIPKKKKTQRVKKKKKKNSRPQSIFGTSGN